MSSLCWIGVITKVPVGQEKIKELIKTLFNNCDDVGFTKLDQTLNYGNHQKNTKVVLKKKPSLSELLDVIENAINTGSMSFNVDSGGDDGFYGIVSIENKNNESINISICLEDFIVQNKKSLKRLVRLIEDIYKSVNAFYAYVTWESGPIMAKGLENYEEFKKVFNEYKKTGKTSFDIKNFRKIVEKYFGIDVS